MQLQIVAKKIDGAYDGALFVNDRFVKVGREADLLRLYAVLAATRLSDLSLPDGTEVVLNAAIATPEELAAAEARELQRPLRGQQ